MNKTLASTIRELVIMVVCFAIGYEISKLFFDKNIIIAIIIMFVLNFVFTMITTIILEYMHPGSLDAREQDLVDRQNLTKNTVKVASEKLKNRKNKK